MNNGYKIPYLTTDEVYELHELTKDEPNSLEKNRLITKLAMDIRERRKSSNPISVICYAFELFIRFLFWIGIGTIAWYYGIQIIKELLTK